MSIVDNRKAFFDFFIEDRYEAGLVLQGWEAKAIRAGRAQLKEAYVLILNEELVLIGAHISPLTAASTHITPDPVRTRKLLLNAAEITKLMTAVAQKGYTIVPLNLHYKGGRIKLDIGVAKGKKQHDKRDTDSERDWKREQARIMKHNY
jgi:SsrA-binding protein